MTSLDRNDQGLINLSFTLPGFRLNILKTEKALQFWATKNSRRALDESKMSECVLILNEIERSSLIRFHLHMFRGGN